MFVSKAEDGSYTGIDKVHQGSPLRIQQCDIFDLGETTKYDTVLCFEIIEHICYRDWPLLFDKLRSLVKPNGQLILTYPHKQKIEEYPVENVKQHDYYIRTVVFGLSKGLLSQWLPGSKHKTLQRPILLSYNHGKSMLWINLWHILSWVTRKRFNRPAFRHTIITFWRNTK